MAKQGGGGGAPLGGDAGHGGTAKTATGSTTGQMVSPGEKAAIIMSASGGIFGTIGGGKKSGVKGKKS